MFFLSKNTAFDRETALFSLKKQRLTPSALWNKAMESVFFEPFQFKTIVENQYQDYLGRPLKKEQSDQFFADRQQILLRIGELDETVRNQWYEKLSSALSVAKVFDPFRDSHALLRTELEHLSQKISNDSELKHKISDSIDQQIQIIAKIWSRPVPQSIKNKLRHVLEKINFTLMINRTTELMPKVFQYLTRKEIEAIPWRESYQGVAEMFTGANRDYYCNPIAMLMTAQLKHLINLQDVLVNVNYPVTHEFNRIAYLNDETHANIKISLGNGFDFILEPQRMKSVDDFVKTILPATKRSVTLNYPRALSFYYSELGTSIADELITQYRLKKSFDPKDLDLAVQYLNLSMQLDPVNSRAVTNYARLVHYFGSDKIFKNQNVFKLLLDAIKKNPFYLNAYKYLSSFTTDTLMKKPEVLRKEDLMAFQNVYLSRQYLSAIILETKRVRDSFKSDEANLKIISEIMLNVYALLETSKNSSVQKWVKEDVLLWRAMILIEDIPLSTKSRKKIFTQNPVAILFKEKADHVLSAAIDQSDKEKIALINSLSKDYSDRDGAKELILKKYKHILKSYQNGNR